jgi:hypothetical protein
MLPHHQRQAEILICFVLIVRSTTKLEIFCRRLTSGGERHDVVVLETCEREGVLRFAHGHTQKRTIAA